MGEKNGKKKISEKKNTYMSFASSFTQVLDMIFKQESLSSLFFQLYSDGLTLTLKNSSAFETGSPVLLEYLTSLVSSM